MWLNKRWQMMMNRCYASWMDCYVNYGARGIYVCDEWHDYENYRKWCESQPDFCRENQVDRIDGEGPYSPDNCRFVTPSQNMRNRRTNVLLSAFGETKTIADWLDDERCQATPSALYQRVVLGWESERAITQPNNDFSTRALTAFGETKEWTEWAKDPRCKVSKTTLVARINRGWGHEKAIITPPDGTRMGRKAPNESIITSWGETKTVTEWLKDERCTYKKRQQIWARINKSGWSPERAMTEPPGRGRPKKS